MANASTRPGFFRRALRVALCYAVALQALAGSVSAAGAIAGAAGFTPVICHGAGSEPPPGDPGTTPKVPCTLCAAAASAVALPETVPVSAPAPTAVRIRHVPAPVLPGSPPPRAGLARAPPQFA
jgi:hypothetical protein